MTEFLVGPLWSIDLPILLKPVCLAYSALIDEVILIRDPRIRLGQLSRCLNDATGKTAEIPFRNIIREYIEQMRTVGALQLTAAHVTT